LQNNGTAKTIKQPEPGGGGLAGATAGRRQRDPGKEIHKEETSVGAGLVDA
jgi:hypothetical protein